MKAGDIMVISTFYTAIIIKLDIFASVIIDERHFKTPKEADSYAQTMRNIGYVAIVAKI